MASRSSVRLSDESVTEKCDEAKNTLQTNYTLTLIPLEEIAAVGSFPCLDHFSLPIRSLNASTLFAERYIVRNTRQDLQLCVDILETWFPRVF